MQQAVLIMYLELLTTVNEKEKLMQYLYFFLNSRLNMWYLNLKPTRNNTSVFGGVARCTEGRRVPSRGSKGTCWRTPGPNRLDVLWMAAVKGLIHRYVKGHPYIFTCNESKWLEASKILLNLFVCMYVCIVCIFVYYLRNLHLHYFS